MARRLMVLAAAMVVGAATPTAHAGDVRFRSGSVQTVAKSAAQRLTAIAALTARGSGGSGRVLMQFSRPLSQADRMRLAGEGIDVQSYLGGEAWFARIHRARVSADRAAAIDFIDDIRPIEARWKLHPQLLDVTVPRWAITDVAYLRAIEAATTEAEKAAAPIPVDPLVAVYVLFHPDVPLEPMGRIRAALHGGAAISVIRSLNGLVVEIPLSRVDDLADDDDVLYVEPALPQFSELNDSSRALVQADIVQALPYDLDGAGVTVLVYDSGTVLDSHPDFGGRVSIRDSSGVRDHSTHVAGTLGGDGAASAGLYRGVAPGVTMESFGFQQPGGAIPGALYSDPGDLEANYDSAINLFGAVIANNSIGSNVAASGLPCEWTGDYGVTAALIDAIVRGSLGSPMRIVWSNGNERQTTRCGDSYKTIAPPAGAKNHITVGAVNSNNDAMTSFSSWGPTDDGRIKPDVVGPGCQSNGDLVVTSTSDVGGYAGRCGTSMSAPAVTGIGALLLEDYRNLYPGAPDFRNATLKAILTHTAVDRGNVGPDFQFGYGSVRAQAAVDQLRSGSFMESIIGQGEIHQAFVEVPPDTASLKVTLAWDDPPGTPNVVPALVNDLDLTIIDPVSGIHFPWTLNPDNPSLPAVRTQADRVNNLEQVVIDAPPAGVYRIEVRGFAVPMGPQTFSLVASPTLLPCTSQGNVTLDLAAYTCESSAEVRVIDCDLNTDDLTVQSVMVTVSSGTEPGGEPLLLLETSPDSATFAAVMPLSAADSPGVLAVVHGDTITALYVDADDGTGGVNVPVQGAAAVDCIDPSAVLVQVTDLQANSATIQVDLDEPASIVINYGTSCGAPATAVFDNALQTSHSIVLTGLTDDTTYFFDLELADAAGNSVLDDNGGACYSFKTEVAVNAFTELYDNSDFDLDNSSIVFLPDASPDFYAACRSIVSGLPVSTDNAITIGIPDDAFVRVDLAGGATVPFYGVNYSSIYVGSNGYITFGAGDASRHESVAQHFALPRIAMLFDDLNPATSGRVSWEQLADRAVVTFEDVPRFNTSNSNSFQIEVFFTGDLRLTWSGIDVLNALAGLSRGMGVPADFLESNLSATAECSPRYPDAQSAVMQVINVLELTVDLSATDDGMPDPPGALDFVITALPAGELRDDSNDHLIAPGELPYVLNAGNRVRYAPASELVALETIVFQATDGGTAPTAGPSNPGRVFVDVVAPITGDVNFDGIVNVVDLLAVLSNWGPCMGCNEDTNGDGLVNVTDLLAVLANWGRTIPPPPSLDTATALTGMSARGETAAEKPADGPRLPIEPITGQREFVNDGVLAPADFGGAARIERDYRQTDRGDLVIELWGAWPLEDHDLLVVRGAAALDGGLRVVLGDDFVPAIGDRFIVLAAESLSGQFTRLDLPDLPRGELIATYGSRTVELSVEEPDAVKPPADRGAVHRRVDVNGDGKVSTADIARLLDEWGRRRARGDVNRDGVVDGADLLLVLEALAG